MTFDYNAHSVLMIAFLLFLDTPCLCFQSAFERFLMQIIKFPDAATCLARFCFVCAKR